MCLKNAYLHFYKCKNEKQKLKGRGQATRLLNVYESAFCIMYYT